MRKHLPGSLDELAGLRYAAWIRESTAEQFDRYGPESQREQIEAFAARFGLVASGLPEFSSAESGKTVWRSDTMGEMLAAARAGQFDVLLTGYFDRWQRNLRRTIEIVEDGLHPAGVAWVMCDRRLLSSDARDWDQIVSEAHEAEKYSKRLSEKISDGLSARFRTRDQWGHPPLGFRRVASGPKGPSVLEVDPATIGQAVGLFRRYALGNVSMEQLAQDTDLEMPRVRDILKNPIYNGWVRRNTREKVDPQRVDSMRWRRRPVHEHELSEARWRSNPPVSDALWERVQQVRAERTRAGGPRREDRVDLLAGLLYCVCGAYVRADGFNGAKQHRRRHERPCEVWGSKERHVSWCWEVPIAAQVAQLQLDDTTVSRIAAALAAPDLPDEVGRLRVKRQRRELAKRVETGTITSDEVSAGLAQLAVEEERIEQLAVAPAMSPDRAIGYLRDLQIVWLAADQRERSDLIHSIYQRIEVRGTDFAGVTLTPEAYAHGLDLALPENVRSDSRVVLACPRGLEPPTFRSAT